MFEQSVVESALDEDWPASLDHFGEPADDWGDPGETPFAQLLESLPADLLDLPAPTEDGGPEWEPGMDSGAVADYTVARMRPSGLLALDLDSSTADPAVMSDAGLIDAIIGWERVAAWAQARQARLLAEFARRRPGDARDLSMADRASGLSRYAPDEVGLALHLSRGTAKARVCESVRLDAELVAARQVWEDGLIDERKIRALCDATLYLKPEQATAVQDRVLDRAPKQTLAQFRAALARAVIAVDPEGANDRHRQARKDRRVVVGDEKDGMAALWAMLSAPDAHSAYQWLTRLARGLGSDDGRGMDARRADLLVALLTGQITYAATGSTDTDSTDTGSTDTGADGASTAADGADSTDPAETGTTVWSGPAPRPVNPGKPLIQIVMPHTTLLGRDDQPCELVGYGPIPAALAREIAADAVWHRLVTDPLSLALLDYGRKTYTPPAALADFVRARDVTCRHPICRRRALDSELDHIVPFPNGPTAEPNLMDGCVHHHKNKHAAGWQVIAHNDGRIEWITPTGHSYVSEPFDYRPEPSPHPHDGGHRHKRPRQPARASIHGRRPGTMTPSEPTITRHRSEPAAGDRVRASPRPHRHAGPSAARPARRHRVEQFVQAQGQLHLERRSGSRQIGPISAVIRSSRRVERVAPAGSITTTVVAASRSMRRRSAITGGISLGSRRVQVVPWRRRRGHHGEEDVDDDQHGHRLHERRRGPARDRRGRGPARGPRGR